MKSLILALAAIATLGVVVPGAARARIKDFMACLQMSERAWVRSAASARPSRVHMVNARGVRSVAKPRDADELGAAAVREEAAVNVC